MRLTKRLLDAMNDALSAALGGEAGEGDFADTPFRDLDDAQTWVCEQLLKRENRNDRS
jgi:hypothetical protein